MERLPYILSALVALQALIQSATQRRARRRSPLVDLLDDRFSAVPRPIVPTLAMGIAAGAAVVAIPWVTGLALGWAQVRFAPAPSAQEWAVGAAAAALHVAYAAVEELVFRGALLPQLVKAARPGVALVVAALVYVASYLGRPGIEALGAYSLLILGLQGVGLGVLFLATHTLWAPVGWTATRNLLLWILYGTGGAFGFPVRWAEHRLTATGTRWVATPPQAGLVDALATAVVVLVALLASRRHLTSSRLDWLRDERPPRLPL